MHQLAESSGSCASCGSSGSSQDDGDVCWICLGGAEIEPLAHPCACPRSVHLQCLSRWRLHKAGSSEEQQCRFCCTTLPDWRDAHRHLPKALPIMSVVHNGVVHQLTVTPGPAGHAEFLVAIRRIYGLDPEDQLQLSFGCKVPGGGEVTLDGSASFDAAVHLASISAGQRLARQQQDQEQPQEAAGVVQQAAGMTPPQEEDDASSSGCFHAVRRLFGA